MLVYGAGATWSRLFLPGTGADPIWLEPESALGPQTSGAETAQKSGSSATLPLRIEVAPLRIEVAPLRIEVTPK